MSTKAHRRREALFKQGAEAYARHGRSQVNLYPCPICGRLFGEEAVDTKELTLEHVPTKSQGHQLVVLTCRKCNSETGHSIDAAASRRKRAQAFSSTVLEKIPTTEPLSVCFDVCGGRLRAELIGEGRRLKLRILEEANDPTTVQEVIRQLEDASEVNLEYATKRFEEQAKLADLKAAFLASFALFGYCYAFNPKLNRVRQMLRAPASTSVANPYFWLSRPRTQSKEVVLLSKDPVAVGVTVGDALVLLPWITSRCDLYEWIERQKTNAASLKLTGVPFAWPKGLEMRLDHLCESSPGVTDHRSI